MLKKKWKLSFVLITLFVVPSFHGPAFSEQSQPMQENSTLDEIESTHSIASDYQPSPFAWEMFIPIFTTQGYTSQWGAGSWVCCSLSPYTFVLTTDGITRRATRQSCEVDATWEGWVDTASEVKDFTWTTVGECNTFSGSFSYKLERGKRYGFRAEWTGKSVTVTTSVYSINRKMNNSNEQPIAPDYTEIVLEITLPEMGIKSPRSCQ